MSSASGDLTNDAAKERVGSKQAPVPRWLPVSLLALTTAAIAVPIVLLRRQQTSILTKSLKGAPPPPRRTSAATVGRSSASLAAGLSSPISTTVGQSSRPNPTLSDNVGAEDDFNGALYTFKAFGYATAMVFASAITTVWGVKTYMGVEDTNEFAARMRLAVLTYMPTLSARIHRPIDEDDGLPETHSDTRKDIDVATWTWSDAERRLTAAFEKDGFSGWAQAAARELEVEGKIERLRRGHT